MHAKMDWRTRLSLLLALAATITLGAATSFRPTSGDVLLKCAPGADVQVKVVFGRFMPTERTTLFQGTRDEQWTRLFHIGKFSTLRELAVACPGFGGARLARQAGGDIPFEAGQGEWAASYKITRSPLTGASPGSWLLGAALWLFLFFLVARELVKKASLFTYANLGLCLAFYLYHYPGFIGPFNPTAVIMNAQAGQIQGWEGSFYSVLVNALLEFAPTVAAAVVPQNVVVFLLLQSLVQLGAARAHRLALFTVFPLLTIISPVVALYTQFFDRAVLCSWLFCLLLLKVFHKFALHGARRAPDIGRTELMALAAFASLLCLLRYEFLIVAGPVLLWCARGRARRATVAGVLALVALLGTQVFDRLDSAGDSWRFRYYVVSMSNYFYVLEANKKLAEDERTLLSKYYALDKMKDGDVWPSLKEFPPGNKDDLKRLFAILGTHLRRDPLLFVTERASVPLRCIGFGSVLRMVATPPIQRYFASDHAAVEAALAGTAKQPGDPAYDSFEQIYSLGWNATPLPLAAGIVFLLVAILLFKQLPVCAMIVGALLAKCLAIAVLAPAYHLAYLFDCYVLLGLLPLLLTLESLKTNAVSPAKRTY